jgi:cation diffusion facilitator CzcD-associated flavoprotein CzcO
MDKIELNTEVIKCRWDESSEVWEVVLQHLTIGSGDLSVPDRQIRAESDGRASVYLQEETIRCKVLVSAVGALVEPKPWPDAISGKDQFKGDIFHSARWRFDVDLKEKDVIVIGSGCSTAQFVPRLIKDYGAKSVTQLMRTPPWIVPRQGAASSDHWDWTPWLNTYVPLYQKSIRYLIAAILEYDWRFFGGSEYSAKERKKMETKLLSHLRKVAPSKVCCQL